MRQTTEVSAGRAQGGPAVGLTLAGLLVFWTLLAVYTVHSQLPPNALELPLESEIRFSLRSLAPQGWAFFTKDPREHRTFALIRSHDGWRLALVGPHAEARNLFGLDRRSRAQGVEIGLLQGQVTRDAWSPCAGRPEECLEQIAAATSLRNPSPEPSLCGTVGLVRKEPVPWAWAGVRHTVSMPGLVLRLHVQC